MLTSRRAGTSSVPNLITALTPVPALLMIPTIARHLRNASYSEQALQYAARYKSLLWQGGTANTLGLGTERRCNEALQLTGADVSERR